MGDVTVLIIHFAAYCAIVSKEVMIAFLREQELLQMCGMSLFFPICTPAHGVQQAWNTISEPFPMTHVSSLVFRTITANFTSWSHHAFRVWQERLWTRLHWFYWTQKTTPWDCADKRHFQSLSFSLLSSKKVLLHWVITPFPDQNELAATWQGYPTTDCNRTPRGRERSRTRMVQGMLSVREKVMTTLLIAESWMEWSLPTLGYGVCWCDRIALNTVCCLL